MLTTAFSIYLFQLPLTPSANVSAGFRPIVSFRSTVTSNSVRAHHKAVSFKGSFLKLLHMLLMMRPLLPITCKPVHGAPSARRGGHSPTPSYSSGPTEIIPRLYVSDLVAAESASTLVALGITHVVSAMHGRVLFPSGVPLKRLQLPLQDSPFAELADYLPTATAFVANALRDPNARVLVHCMQGVSRSTSVVCAFLIAHYGWTPEQAVAYVKSKRSSAEPNCGFVKQLAEYAQTLKGAPR
ncbi:Dual specificity protein phosphatase 13 isoform A [Grifola frondosa]|uniref:protein-tyrosine-phosphatase n=1 Tax=Grifola frondosa TaxID=5627 RepID=A0A1C7LM86_GRIFR|nr:Dual specificity protein phosphatase 13 isoform A [Grifola frondosa]